MNLSSLATVGLGYFRDHTSLHIALLFAVLLHAPAVSAQDFDALFKDWTDASSPGAAVAVVHNGRVVFAKGYGAADLEHGIPITADTVFPVASVSKQFTAMAALLLERDGKLSLDKDIHTYLPELPDYGQTVTVRDLLQHTSGIRDQWQLLEMSGERMDDVLTQDYILRLLFRQKGLNFAPGSRFLYSNGGYTLASEIVARVSGRSFAVFCRDAIFQPLKMDHTHFHEDIRRLTSHRAESYRKGAAGWEHAIYNYATVGATGLETTANDLAKWLDNFRTQQVGGPAVLSRMRQRTKLADGSTVPNGLGVGVAPAMGLERVGHNGADAGYRSSISYYPGPVVGVAVLSNAAEFPASRLAGSVVAALMNLPPEPREVEKDPASMPHPAIHVPVEELGLMEGAYRLGGGGIVDVRVANDGHIDVAMPGEEYRPATVTAPRQLWLPSASAEIHFSQDPAIRIVQTGVRTGSILRKGPPPTPSLQDYVGRYESDELAVEYTASASTAGLVINHIRRGESRLRPVTPDRFVDLSGRLGELIFNRDDRGNVVSFRAGYWNMPGIQFRRR